MHGQSKSSKKILFSASGCSLKMDSKILSVNKTYECELQKLLPPAVRDKQNWKLCYRHSTDDNLSDGSSVFHPKCDGKTKTVIIVKVVDYMFGGYTLTLLGVRICRNVQTSIFVLKNGSIIWLWCEKRKCFKER